MHNPPATKSLTQDADSTDRRDRILVDLQEALARQTRRRRLLRIGNYFALFACIVGVVSWWLVVNDEFSSHENGNVAVSSPPNSAPVGVSPSKYADVIVHSKPELLNSVLLSNRDMATRTNVISISDDELLQLIASSSVPLVVAKIDNQLVAVPLKTKTKTVID